MNNKYPINLIIEAAKKRNSKTLLQELTTSEFYNYKDFDASVEYILLSTLDERERYVINKIFKDNRTLQSIEKVTDLSIEKIKEIKNKALSKLSEQQNLDIMLFGVRGYIDNELKIKFGDNADQVRISFLNDKITYLTTIINDLSEHVKNFTKEPYISCYTEDKNIEELKFSIRTYNCLKRIDIKTIRDILNNRERILYGKIPGLDEKSRNEIINKIKFLGFEKFDMEDK